MSTLFRAPSSRQHTADVVPYNSGKWERNHVAAASATAIAEKKKEEKEKAIAEALKDGNQFPALGAAVVVSKKKKKLPTPPPSPKATLYRAPGQVAAPVISDAINYENRGKYISLKARHALVEYFATALVIVARIKINGECEELYQDPRKMKKKPIEKSTMLIRTMGISKRINTSNICNNDVEEEISHVERLLQSFAEKDGLEDIPEDCKNVVKTSNSRVRWGIIDQFTPNRRYREEYNFEKYWRSLKDRPPIISCGDYLGDPEAEWR